MEIEYSSMEVLHWEWITLRKKCPSSSHAVLQQVLFASSSQNLIVVLILVIFWFISMLFAHSSQCHQCYVCSVTLTIIMVFPKVKYSSKANECCNGFVLLLYVCIFLVSSNKCWSTFNCTFILAVPWKISLLEWW